MFWDAIILMIGVAVGKKWNSIKKFVGECLTEIEKD